ncbi:MAG: hypothetical protein J5I94_12575 [Phaeodactylibacter sp.]|nr:hypothetical protein [Phaeodactylibacter sp.]
MKGRQYQHRQILSSNGWMIIGREYLLRDGTYTARVKLLRDRSTNDALKFRFEILQSNADNLEAGNRITSTTDWEGSGTWQILEADTWED